MANNGEVIDLISSSDEEDDAVNSLTSKSLVMETFTSSNKSHSLNGSTLGINSPCEFSDRNKMQGSEDILTNTTSLKDTSVNSDVYCLSSDEETMGKNNFLNIEQSRFDLISDFLKLTKDKIENKEHATNVVRSLKIKFSQTKLEYLNSNIFIDDLNLKIDNVTNDKLNIYLVLRDLLDELGSNKFSGKRKHNNDDVGNRQAQKKRKSSSENTETFFNSSKNSSQAIPPNDVIVIDSDSDENMSENNEVISDDDDIEESKPQSSTQNENIDCPSTSTAELENTEKIKIKDANAVPSTSTAESNNLKKNNIEVDNDVPSTSTTELDSAKKKNSNQIDSDVPSTSTVELDNAENNKEKKKIASKLKKYEMFLNMMHNKIVEIDQKELDLDDMNKKNSAFAIVSRLKEQIVKTHKKYCQLQNISDRIHTKTVNIDASKYPRVNKYVQAYVKKTQKFPDLAIVRCLVTKASKQYNLNLDKCQIESIAKPVFKQVGSQLKKSRTLELDNLLLDYYQEGSSVEDPALHDPELEKKLKANAKISKENLNREDDKHVKLQEALKQGRESRSSKRAKLVNGGSSAVDLESSEDEDPLAVDEKSSSENEDETDDV